MSNVINAPEEIYRPLNKKTIFLAGSIEMGKATPWQDAIINEFKDDDRFLFYNPRRPDWDNDFGEEEVRVQVEWELHALENADMILMYYDPKTQSPISLLELGLFARSGKLVVCCPEGFWKKQNVDITCQKYNVITVDDVSYDGLIDYLNRI